MKKTFVERTVANLLTITLYSLIISGCSNSDEEDRTENVDRNLNSSRNTFIYNAIPENSNASISTEYSDAVNGFSVELLSTVYNQSEFMGNNLVLSPFSLSRNLSVLTEGAVGQTRAELLSALGGEVVLADATNALSELLYADNSVIFQCADALWLDSDRFTLNSDFRSTIISKYGVELAELPLDNSVNSLNSWISKNTGNQIPSFLKNGDIDDNTAAVLVNAVYFEADWESPFDVLNTTESPFYTSSGITNVSMMKSDYNHNIYKTDEYESVKLYYGSEGKNYFYLDIYMPTAGTIQEFLSDGCEQALKVNETEGYGELQMPKIDFSSSIDLVPVLKEMGVQGAFESSQGELYGITDNPDDSLYVQVCKQKAGIKTDEEGTRAYAATVTMMGTGSAAPSESTIIDKPFVYFIRGGDGLILFAGVVNNPNQK